MYNRPQKNITLQQWYQMQQQGYVKKKGCNCGGKKKKVKQDQWEQEGK